MQTWALDTEIQQQHLYNALLYMQDIFQKVVHLQKPASMDLGASSYYHLGLYNVQTLLNLIFTF